MVAGSRPPLSAGGLRGKDWIGVALRLHIPIQIDDRGNRTRIGNPAVHPPHQVGPGGDVAPQDAALGLDGEVAIMAPLPSSDRPPER